MLSAAEWNIWLAQCFIPSREMTATNEVLLLFLFHRQENWWATWSQTGGWSSWQAAQRAIKEDDYPSHPTSKSDQETQSWILLMSQQEWIPSLSLMRQESVFSRGCTSGLYAFCSLPLKDNHLLSLLKRLSQGIQKQPLHRHPVTEMVICSQQPLLSFRNHVKYC